MEIKIKPDERRRRTGKKKEKKRKKKEKKIYSKENVMGERKQEKFAEGRRLYRQIGY
jgi:hypothetical protein